MTRPVARPGSDFRHSRPIAGGARGFLENMSVPPTSVITVERPELPGKRFRLGHLRLYVSASGSKELVLEDDRVRAMLEQHGEAAALAILACAPGLPGGMTAAGMKKRIHGTIRKLAADPSTPALLQALFAERLAAAGIPERAGVFVPPPAGEDMLEAMFRPYLELGATLAVLSRRSGSLYLPSRPFQPSLVNPTASVLFFPDDVTAREGGEVDAPLARRRRS